MRIGQLVWIQDLWPAIVIETTRYTVELLHIRGYADNQKGRTFIFARGLVKNYW